MIHRLLSRICRWIKMGLIGILIIPAGLFILMFTILQTLIDVLLKCAADPN